MVYMYVLMTEVSSCGRALTRLGRRRLDAGRRILIFGQRPLQQG